MAELRDLLVSNYDTLVVIVGVLAVGYMLWNGRRGFSVERDTALLLQTMQRDIEQYNCEGLERRLATVDRNLELIESEDTKQAFEVAAAVARSWLLTQRKQFQEAHEVYRRAIHLIENGADVDRSQEVYLYGSLIRSLLMLDQREEALRRAGQLREIAEETGDDDVDEVAGILLHQFCPGAALQCEPDLVKEFADLALRLLRQNNPYNGTANPTTWATVAHCCMWYADYQSAVEYLNGAESIVATSVIEEAAVLEVAADLDRVSCRLCSATSNSDRAITLVAQGFGKNSVEYLETLSRRARIWMIEGRYEQARSLLQQICQHTDRWPDAIRTVPHLANLAVSEARYGDFDVARRLCAEATELTDGRLDYPFMTASTSLIAGWCLMCECEYPRAAEQLEFAVNQVEKCFGPNHPMTAEFLLQYAAALGPQNPEQALSVIQRAEQNHRPVSNFVPQTAREIQAEKANILQRLGRPDEARPLIEPVARDVRQVLLPTSLEIAFVNQVHGRILASLGLRDQAVRLFEQAIACREQSQRPDHPQLAELREELARIGG